MLENPAAPRATLARFVTLAAFVLSAATPARASSDPKDPHSAPVSVSNNLPEAPTPNIDLRVSYSTSSDDDQTPQQPQQPAQTDADKRKAIHEEGQREVKQQEHQRVLGIAPMFNAASGKTVPLTPGQKFSLAFHSATDPFQFGLAAIVSGIGQADGSHQGYEVNAQGQTVAWGYGQGIEGYAKRYGANYVDNFDGAIIGNALFPTILHQDPRYYPLAQGKFIKRLAWAVASTIRCKGDNGKWQPNYSNILGNIASGGISNLYYPKQERGVGLTFENGIVVSAEGAFGATLLEFFPDINRLYEHHKQRVQAKKDAKAAARTQAADTTKR